MNKLLISYVWKLKLIVQPKKGFDSRKNKRIVEPPLQGWNIADKV